LTPDYVMCNHVAMSGELARQWGINVRAFRRAHDSRTGVSPTDGMRTMAEALGVSVATVSRWETGKMTPRDELKVEIAEYLDVDVRALFPLVRRAS